MSLNLPSDPKSSHKLVIFDMDGTLINTETLANHAWAHASQHLNEPLTPDQARDLFRGHTMDVSYEIVKQRNGGYIPSAFQESLAEYWHEASSTQIEATENAHVLLEKLDPVIDICVATNSGRPSALGALTAVELIETFGPHRVFTFDDVDVGKPAPDLFLKAASERGFTPTECIVLEDSPVGLTAAASASMDAVGFYGHDPASKVELTTFDVPVIEYIEDFIGHIRLP